MQDRYEPEAKDVKEGDYIAEGLLVETKKEVALVQSNDAFKQRHA